MAAGAMLGSSPRAAARPRAAATRAATTAEPSPRGARDNSCAAMGRTSMAISIRSSSGPERRAV